MEDNFLAWKKTFHEYGIEIKRDDYFPLEGLLLKEVAKNICKKYNLICDISNLVELKNKFYLANNKFRFYLGVEFLVKSLKEKYKLALVSASPKEKIKKTVPKDFLNKFDAIISGDDVKNGKPDPEPYLNALKKLSIDKQNAIVIENAPLGIQSAKSAWIYCIAVASTLGEDSLKQADKIILNIENLKEIFS
jgi:beta-phosphoglucomutase